MEAMVTHVIERKKDGTSIVRNFFFNEDKTNYLLKAQSHFAKDEKKQAKLNHRISLKNPIKNSQEREFLIAHFVNQKFPDWDLKFAVLK